MVHEGAKLNNFNAVCLIIVAHEGAKFNEPLGGLTNQLCWRHNACVKWGYSVSGGMCYIGVLSCPCQKCQAKPFQFLIIVVFVP